MEAPETNTTTQATINMGIGSSKVRHGTILEVICDEHYEFPLTSMSPPTCNNGTWSTIPRCVPARCKTLPKPPKFGMVISPKTEHGMKARFKCKDGWQLATPAGKQITDQNENVLTCSFGNWTGETPICQEGEFVVQLQRVRSHVYVFLVYCQFPGTIANGKVLLVGNMGLYDYRPYVKKVINNKQIMYDCDKGYVLENGPVSVSAPEPTTSPPPLTSQNPFFQSGATCIGGKWSPAELPECLPGQHPRLRWNRKKRSVDLKFARGKFMLNHYRNIKRKHFDHHRVEDFVNVATRAKRSSNAYRGQMGTRMLTVIQQNRDKQLKRKRRNLERNPERDMEIDKAYSKYYEKIRARYRNYVKNLFPSARSRSSSNPSAANQQDAKKLQVQDGRWYNSFNNPEFRYRATHKSRTLNNDLQNDEYEAEMGPPVALPSINDPTRSNRYDAPNHTVSNYYPSYHNQERHFPSEEAVDTQKKPNNTMDAAATIFAQLQSQIVRRKRDTDDDLDEKDDKDRPEAGGKGKKHRGPCEPLLNPEHMQMEVVKPAKNQNESFGHGMVLKITCDSGFNSNIQTANSTVRCNKGVWKPVKPTCSLSEFRCFWFFSFD